MPSCATWVVCAAVASASAVHALAVDLAPAAVEVVEGVVLLVDHHEVLVAARAAVGGGPPPLAVVRGCWRASVRGCGAVTAAAVLRAVRPRQRGGEPGDHSETHRAPWAPGLPSWTPCTHLRSRTTWQELSRR